jgi:N-acetylglucosaminyldiphosphoundecaprenol N-acetyl-beta-D-mannosaminyltransferase
MSIEPPVSRIGLNGIPLTPMSLDRAFHWIIDRAARPGAVSIVTTVNLQLLRTARTHPAFATVLRERAAVNLVDGAPVAWLLRHQGVVDAVTAPGSDLTRRLLVSEQTRGPGVFLLGDAPATIEAVRERGRNEGWGATIRGAESPAPEVVDNPRSSEAVVERINATRARILLVAFGAPRQELWLDRWRDRLDVRVAIGIGGSLKFIAWPQRRAPSWMRHNGLEWLHRLGLEPARLLPRYARDASELGRLLATQLISGRR